jgi:putative membrane protein
MLTKYIFPALALALVCSGFNAFSEDAYPGDLAFVRQANVHGMFEVEAGKLALKNASSEDVRTLGAVMILDHTKLNDQLKMMAKAKDWNISNSLTTKYQTLIEEFTELRRRDFDREYSSEMSTIHKMDREGFENAAKYASDPDLLDWAKQVAPLLNKHTALIPELKEVKTVIIVK